MKIVTVRPGDTLELIAKRELGDDRKWPILFDLNASVIALDNRNRAMRRKFPRSRRSDWIFPGQRLRVPEARS